MAGYDSFATTAKNQIQIFHFSRSHTESTDFEMITGFLQGFVDNEINLNAEETCQRTCSDYQLTRQFGCHNDTFCAEPLKNTRINRCRGYVRDCEFIESDVEICPSVWFKQLN